MAKRPIFIPSDKTKNFCETKEIEFKYYNGFAQIQKLRSIQSLHEAAKESLGIEAILEISSKSSEKLGWQLSAFNLQRTYQGKKVTVEALFQGSKVFGQLGPYTDIYDLDPLSAKKDRRTKISGELTGFSFDGILWPNEPKSAFYEWLYISTIYQDYFDLIPKICEFQAFSDIEFNPKRSFSCQAKACAILVSLHRANLLDVAVESKESFLDIVYPSKKKPQQGTFGF